MRWFLILLLFGGLEVTALSSWLGGSSAPATQNEPDARTMEDGTPWPDPKNPK